MENNNYQKFIAALTYALTSLSACSPKSIIQPSTEFREVSRRSTLPERAIEQNYIYVIDKDGNKRYVGYFNPLDEKGNVAALSGLEQGIIDLFAAESAAAFASKSNDEFPQYHTQEQLQDILKVDYEILKNKKGRDPNDRDLLELNYQDMLTLLRENSAFGFVRIEPTTNPDGSVNTYRLQICTDGFTGMIYYNKDGKKVKLQDHRLDQPDGLCTAGEQVLNYGRELEKPLDPRKIRLDHPYMIYRHGVDTYRCRTEDQACRNQMRRIEAEINTRNADRMKRNQNSGARK